MPDRPPPDLSLGHARWPQAEGRPLLLVPVGSTEQHGPHLPCGTDAIVAASVARRAARRLDESGRDVLVAPVLPYGASGEHEDFPGTVSIGHEALHLVLVELARSACRWARAVVVVNGHGGNAPTVVRAVEQLRAEGREVAWTSCGTPGADAHAGATETALMLYLAPWAVRLDLAEAGVTDPVEGLLPALRAQGVRAVSANGVLGDPTGATVAEGRRLVEGLVDRLVAELSALKADERGRLSR